jgi:hypothetical protein
LLNWIEAKFKNIACFWLGEFDERSKLKQENFLFFRSNNLVRGLYARVEENEIKQIHFISPVKSSLLILFYLILNIFFIYC